jgi:Tfp pilus assembly protein PilW
MTLVELLVAAAIGMALFLGSMVLFNSIARIQEGVGNRVEGLAQQRVGLERMTRELRQALTVNLTGPHVVDFQLRRPATAAVREVRFDCGQAAQCRRYEGPLGGPLGPNYAPLVSGVQSASFAVETLAASQDYLAIELRVAVPGREMPIVLADGVHLRNKGAQ